MLLFSASLCFQNYKMGPSGDRCYRLFQLDRGGSFSNEICQNTARQLPGPGSLARIPDVETLQWILATYSNQLVNIQDG